MSSEYATAAHVHERYDIARSSLRAWAESGRIAALRVGGTGKRLYKLADIERILGIDEQEKKTERIKACYTRVSSQHQRGDLERQCAFLQHHYPDHKLYSDVGSGLNFKRPQFKALLDAVHNNAVEEIVVTDKDRLCRFGTELVQWLLDKTDTKLVVHSDPASAGAIGDESNYNHELSDDIISVISFFTARHNGQRAARNRKRRRQDAVVEEEASQEEEKEGKRKRARKGASRSDSEDSSVSHA